MKEKLLTALFLLSVTLVCVSVPMGFLYARVEQEERQTEADAIAALAQTVPLHYDAYYTPESVTALEEALAALPQEASEEPLPSRQELAQMRSDLEAALKGLTYRQSEVMQFFIDTEEQKGNELEKDDGYVTAAVTMVGADGSIDTQGGKIKVRGNSTAKAPKKPFKLKFDEKQNLLGMGSAKSWVLLANCLDPTLVRNHVMFDFARQLGFAYVPQDAFVEVWLDGVFKGCYELMEPIQVSEERLNIDTEGCKDFLLEVEAEREEEEKYLYADELRFAIKEPESPTDEQFDYMAERFVEMVETVKEGSYDEIATLLDIDSFVKLYVLNEYGKNVDFGYSSVFFYYQGGKWYAGPPWDFDLSLGNLNPGYVQEHYALAADPEGIFGEQQLYAWLCQREEFMAEVKQVYADNSAYIGSLYAEGGVIDSAIQQHANVFQRNFHEAGWVIREQHWVGMRKPDTLYAQNVNFLKDWCARRDAWLRENWGLTDGSDPTSGETSGGARPTL